MSESKASHPVLRQIRTVAIVVVAGAVLAPIAVYVFGVNLIAPYEGDGGLLGFMGSVYADAFKGKVAAWALVLSPAAFVLTWWAVVRLFRARRPVAEPGS